ncbi:hypothetical protein KFK09_001715 [Dendrobium nobile]|uniref:Uncharacterized protein n=1 Tax=Dendrobium nobile TaxID=94219 RepID=A0A8T3C875_DENNO|nr:hypothetical protein KFK09_001715 [Dendrobium nobile]
MGRVGALGWYLTKRMSLLERSLSKNHGDRRERRYVYSSFDGIFGIIRGPNGFKIY